MVNRHVGMILIVLFMVSCSGSGGPPADQMINLGSHSLHVVLAGEGTPAVVFDGGIGARCEEYRELQDRISAFTTVVV